MNKEETNLLSDPKSLLSMIQILMLIGTIFWVIGVQGEKIETIEVKTERNSESIILNRERTAAVEIRQAVTDEQYRQIIQRLEQLKNKLDQEKR